MGEKRQALAFLFPPGRDASLSVLLVALLVAFSWSFSWRFWGDGPIPQARGEKREARSEQRAARSEQ